MAESYKKLDMWQTEGANSAGVLYGGAVIQSAMKRAHNEGITKASDEAALKQQLEDDATKEGRLKESGESGLGKLARESQRALEGYGEEGANLGNKEQLFEEGENRLKGVEAAGQGYVLPSGVWAHTSGQPGAGFVRVGQPLKKQRPGL